MVKSTCADVPMTKHLVQPKYEKVALAFAESLLIGWDLGASVFVVSYDYMHCCSLFNIMHCECVLIYDLVCTIWTPLHDLTFVW